MIRNVIEKLRLYNVILLYIIRRQSIYMGKSVYFHKLNAGDVFIFNP